MATKMFQFAMFPILSDLYKEVPLGNSGFNTFMRFAQTFRSLTRPSSALEPSYPPDSLFYSYARLQQYDHDL